MMRNELSITDASPIFFCLLPTRKWTPPDLVFNPDDEHPSPSSIPLISLNALAGMLVPETFCIYDTIHHHLVVIMVDGGNTHNFI